ncbi:MAG: hypothetical protein HY271_10550 [Deltaproteobacteria bacterium]|nr:hypothetical protein [Deltaproteobacteria bacterium]
MQCARAAYALHSELRDVYDALEEHLAAARWEAAAALAARRQAIELALRPLAAVRQALSTPEEVAPWIAVDAMARDLNARRTDALRLAGVARDAVGAELVRLHGTRTNAAHYRDATPAIPIFASRRA